MNYSKTKKVLKVKEFGIEMIYLTIGCAIMAVGTALFLLPNQLSSGGFTGIATIFYYLFHFPVGTVIFVLNIPFFIWAFFKIGKKVIIKSIIGTSLLSIFIDYLWWNFYWVWVRIGSKGKCVYGRNRFNNIYSKSI